MSVAIAPWRHADRARRSVRAGGGRTGPKRLVVSFGFWLFLLSDIVMFAALVRRLRGACPATTAGGPPAHSSSTCSMLRSRPLPAGLELHLRPASLAPSAAKRSAVLCSPLVTWLLGAAFLGLEVTEFSGWSRKAPGRRAAPSCRHSSRWSGTHGLHVTSGLLWLLVMMAQVATLAFGRRHAAPLCFACSGTPWTSSGSACSPSSI